MRRTLLIPPLALAILLACDDAFDPHGEFTERPVLYCVMTSGPARAMLTRTVPSKNLLVDADGFASPVIRGAEISLSMGPARFRLTESLDTLNAGTPEQLIQLTYRNSYVYLLRTEAISFNALLPDGRVLAASTKVPGPLYFERSYEFPHGFTTAISPENRGTTWTFSWESTDGHLYFPEILLNYVGYRTDGTTALRSVPIPQRMLLEGGREVPAYPQPTYEGSCGFDFQAFDFVLARLALTESEFRQIGIRTLVFRVTTYDVPLARFYTSAHGAMDPYSIRIDETVYSNVSGGIGVFGTYVVDSLEQDVDEAYIESFGYVKR